MPLGRHPEKQENKLVVIRLISLDLGFVSDSHYVFGEDFY